MRLAGADRRRGREALSGFAGAKRRFEELGTTASGARVVDDYAHHPTEVAATIAAARSQGPARVVAVFQPHLYSRTRELAAPFGEALAAADRRWCCRLSGAGARGGLPGRQRAADRRRCPPCGVVRRGRGAAGAELRDGDLCLVMGAGDVDTLGRMLVGGGEPL